MDDEHKVRKQVVNSYQILSVEMVWLLPREDEGVREAILHIGPIPKVIRLKLFLDHPYPKGIR